MLYCRQFHSFYFCQLKVLDNYSAYKVVLAELYVLVIRKARLDVSLLQACDFLSFGKEFKSLRRDVRLQEPSNLTFARHEYFEGPFDTLPIKQLPVKTEQSKINTLTSFSSIVEFFLTLFKQQTSECL